MRFRQVVFVLGVVFSFAVGATAQEEALSDTLKAIAFSPDGKLLVSGSSNKTVSLWNFETGALLHKLEGHTDPINPVGFSADSKLIVSGADDVWGYQTDADYSNLLVGADGTYQLAVRAINQYDKKVNWAEHSALEKKSKFNVLRVERRANSVTFLGQKLKNMDQYTYHFFLNGALVNTFKDWPAVWGDSVGFRVSEGAKIEVDYVKITVP